MERFAAQSPPARLHSAPERYRGAAAIRSGRSAKNGALGRDRLGAVARTRARLARLRDKAAASTMSSRSTASGTISDMIFAPWLPPNTKSRSSPPCSGGAKADAAAATTAVRTGLPTRVSFAASCGCASSTPAKLVAIALTRAASSLLARPMTAFCS
jgi:hypothetical protein